MRLLEQVYNPDILNCLANLSNDEVFTPPEVVNNMLDMLPQELFRSTETTFLDPACKTGVFLREVAKRLMTGLSLRIPDEEERRRHIFTKQLFGIAITEMTSLLSRRSLYCSKFANTVYSIVPFETIDGNIRFKNTNHYWDGNKCGFCGVSKAQYDRDNSLEQHAYEFIHTIKPEEIFKVRFDVIIGNPPYQLETDGAGKQARPIYHHFVEQAKKLSPRYLSFIIPSRWFAGGMGLGEFRTAMLNDERISHLVDFSMSTECFPGVDIAGGVCYFLWEKDHTGACEYTHSDGGNSSSKTRKLNEFDVFIRNNAAVSIVHKTQSKNEKSVSSLMSSLGPFGLQTSERGRKTPCSNCYNLLSSQGMSYIEKTKVNKGTEYIDKWKVIIGKATSAGAATAGKDGLRKVIATIETLPPNSVCTFSYFIGGAFTSEREAMNYKAYLSTKFARFLLLQCLTSIDITKDKFLFVPSQDFSRVWTDSELYQKYHLTSDEIAVIESTIRPMD